MLKLNLQLVPAPERPTDNGPLVVNTNLSVTRLVVNTILSLSGSTLAGDLPILEGSPFYPKEEKRARQNVELSLPMEY